MSRISHHHLSYASTCRRTGRSCKGCLDFIDALGTAVASAHPVSHDDFSVEGYIQLQGCGRKCTVGWRADFGHAYLFGDIDDKHDLDDLVDLARSLGQYNLKRSGPKRPTAVPSLMLVLDLNLERRKAA